MFSFEDQFYPETFVLGGGDGRCFAFREDDTSSKQEQEIGNSVADEAGYHEPNLAKATAFQSEAERILGMGIGGDEDGPYEDEDGLHLAGKGDAVPFNFEDEDQEKKREAEGSNWGIDQNPSPPSQSPDWWKPQPGTEPPPWWEDNETIEQQGKREASQYGFQYPDEDECPECGWTGVELMDFAPGMLQCEFCGHQWEDPNSIEVEAEAQLPIRTDDEYMLDTNASRRTAVSVQVGDQYRIDGEEVTVTDIKPFEWGNRVYFSNGESKPEEGLHDKNYIERIDPNQTSLFASRRTAEGWGGHDCAHCGGRLDENGVCEICGQPSVDEPLEVESETEWSDYNEAQMPMGSRRTAETMDQGAIKSKLQAGEDVSYDGASVTGQGQADISIIPYLGNNEEGKDLYVAGWGSDGQRHDEWFSWEQLDDAVVYYLHAAMASRRTAADDIFEGREEDDNWYPASQGTEQPMRTRDGRMVQYMFNPATGQHAYIDLETDIIIPDEDLGLYGLGSRRTADTATGIPDPVVEQTDLGWQVMVWSPATGDFIPQGQPWGSEEEARTDAAQFAQMASRRTGVEIGERWRFYPDGRDQDFTDEGVAVEKTDFAVWFDENGDGEGDFRYDFSRIEDMVQQGLAEKVASRRTAKNFGEAADWQLDSGTLQTDPVQFWSATGTMISATMPLQSAKEMVGRGSAFVISDQAIGLYEDSPTGQIMGNRQASQRMAVDSYTEKHLDDWLYEQFVDEDERAAAKAAILGLVETDPTLIDHPEDMSLNKGWPELLDMAGGYMAFTAARRTAADDIQEGDRVTGESPTWFDGSPVAGWPTPNYLGTVVEVFDNYGVPTAKVKFDSGRTGLKSLDELHKIEARRSLFRGDRTAGGLARRPVPMGTGTR